MSAPFALGSPAITSQDLNQAKSAQAMRVLKGQVQNADAGKIDKAAKDFESILLDEWLEKAEKSFATVPGADQSENTDPGHDQFQSIGCEFLSGALTRAGGIGIASMISKRLKATEASHAASEAALNPGNQAAEVTPGKVVSGGLQSKE
jgi:Rod binding domain-containing protein